MSKRLKLLEASILINLILITFVVILVVREKPNEVTLVTTLVAVTAVTQIAPTDTLNSVAPATATLPPADTPEPTFTPTATELPTETAVPSTATSTPFPTNTAAPTNMPTAIPTDTPTLPPTPTLLPPQPWLTYLNDLRQIANLPTLTENADLTAGSLAHSQYMVLTDIVAHNEEGNSELYSDIGANAAANSVIFTTGTTIADFEWAMNYWFSMPFHALPLLDPRLQKVGYGDYVEEIGAVNMAATLDIYSAPRAAAPADMYPIFYPADGSHVWITRQSQLELPDPLSSCDFERPSGPPIIVQLGSGDITPDVTNVVLQRGNVFLDVCYFDETSYINADPSAQRIGRDLLNTQDAIIIIPMSELTFGPAYTVTLEVSGVIYTWSFDVQVRTE